MACMFFLKPCYPQAAAEYTRTMYAKQGDLGSKVRRARRAVS